MKEVSKDQTTQEDAGEELMIAEELLTGLISDIPQLLDPDSEIIIGEKQRFFEESKLTTSDS